MAKTITTEQFLDACNDEYQKRIVKSLDAIRKKVEEWIQEEAAEVYIARSYRASHGLPVLPRDAQKNDRLAEGVTSSSVEKVKNMFRFIVTNMAKPSPPLFSDTMPEGDGLLSLWTIGDAEYNNGASSGSSYIHPLINWGKSLDMSTFYDGDPYIERAVEKHRAEIEKSIKDAISKAVIESIRATIKKYQLRESK